MLHLSRPRAICSLHARIRTANPSPNQKRVSKAKIPNKMGPWGAVAKRDPFPPRFSANLTYMGKHTLTAGSSGLFGVEQVYRLNSLFDPDFTGTGHQPYGFDQIAALYDQYKVNAVSLKLTFTEPAADGIGIITMVQPSAATYSLASSAFVVSAEKQGTAVSYLNNTGIQHVTQQARLEIPTLEGVTKSQFANDIGSFNSLCTTNPALTPWLRMAICMIDGSAASTCTVAVEITFECDFWSRAVLSQS
jgi:hypothetical protein